MLSSKEWMFVTIGAIWLAVLLTSVFSPTLVVGSDGSEFRVVALINWLWGGIATAFVLRATIFNADQAIDWDDSDALIWIAFAVAGVWLAVTVISVAGPELVISDVRVPVAALLSPIAGVVLTSLATDFLVSGFRNVESAEVA